MQLYSTAAMDRVYNRLSVQHATLQYSRNQRLNLRTYAYDSVPATRNKLDILYLYKTTWYLILADFYVSLPSFTAVSHYCKCITSFIHTANMGWCDTDPNELVLTFRCSYVCANFGGNRSRNATVRVPTDGYTDTVTDWQTQTSFIICPCYML